MTRNKNDNISQITMTTIASPEECIYTNIVILFVVIIRHMDTHTPAATIQTLNIEVLHLCSITCTIHGLLCVYSVLLTMQSHIDYDNVHIIICNIHFTYNTLYVHYKLKLIRISQLHE